ncbi:hypothetical protein D3C81_1598180 [compost metagenome]
MQLFETVAVEQARDRGLARQQYGQIAQRTIQPAGQQATAHGGLAAINHRLQGVIATTGQVGVEFEVATACTVQHHGVIQAFVAQAAQVGQGGALGFLGVGQQATGRADCQGQVLAAKTLQVLGGELLAKAFQC